MIIRNISSTIVALGGTRIQILPGDEKHIDDDVYGEGGLKALVRLKLIEIREDPANTEKPAETPADTAPKRGRKKADPAKEDKPEEAPAEDAE